jgi:hypothetical protein
MSRITDQCYICKLDLSPRVNDAGGSRRKRFPAHTRVVLFVSNGVRTVSTTVMACEAHGVALQDACTSAGVPKPDQVPSPNLLREINKAKPPKKPRIEVVTIEGEKVIKTIDLSNPSPRYVERVMTGLMMNMDTDKYFAREVDCD